MRLARVGLCAFTTAFALLAPASAQDGPSSRFQLPANEVLLDETIPIVATGIAPKSAVTIRLRGGGPDVYWTSSATFTADASGRVDLTQMAPVNGSYKGIDPMGLFWSARAERSSAASPDEDDAAATPADWTLTADIEGRTVARATIRRLSVAHDVRLTRVRDDGLVGTYYQPATEGRHPALIVLGGSGGGLPPPGGIAGGLASRGYAVLSLAYFGAPGLPRSLSNIPLEYFGKALQWLTSQPGVDPMKVGVVGSSRGAELALLLGVTYPMIHTVVAYMPSNVVWRGCCDPTAAVAWTLERRPIAPAPPLGRRGNAFGAQPEIPVERIQGAVLLISGRDDGVWQSSEMAERIMSRLRSHRFGYAYRSLVYDHAGHGIGRPYTPTTDLDSRRHPLSGRAVQMGGTPEGTAKAREDSWRQMLDFINQQLRDRR